MLSGGVVVMNLPNVQPPAPAHAPPRAADAPHPRLRERTILLVGLMGAGKSTVGRGLAAALQLPFRDADEEIERAARRTVAEIFAERGEQAFREGERRVIARLITSEPPHVLAAGGGAFMDAETRALARRAALCVWLKADLEVIVRRVSRRNTRPLLHGRDPMEVLNAQALQRYAHYGEAHVTVETADANVAVSVAGVLDALHAHLDREARA
jgi:shikimate kinase